MKMIQIALICTATICSCVTFAQSKEEQKSKNQPTSGDNFMNMQSKVITDLFGSDLSGTPDGRSIGFLELLDKIELTPEQKLEYKNLYYLQARELTKEQKDSLSNVLEKKLRETQLEN